jgi:hypothetical protein
MCVWNSYASDPVCSCPTSFPRERVSYGCYQLHASFKLSAIGSSSVFFVLLHCNLFTDNVLFCFSCRGMGMEVVGAETAPAEVKVYDDVNLSQ